MKTTSAYVISLLMETSLRTTIYISKWQLKKIVEIAVKSGTAQWYGYIPFFRSLVYPLHVDGLYVKYDFKFNIAVNNGIIVFKHVSERDESQVWCVCRKCLSKRPLE